MKRCLTTFVAMVAGLACLAGRAPAQGLSTDKNLLVITLAGEMVCDDSIIYLGQIAKISGGTLELRRRAAKLDIAELRPSIHQAVIPAAQVQFRLLLAGIDSSKFKLTGSSRTVISESDDPLAPRKLYASAEEALRQKLTGSAAKSALSLVDSFTVPRLDLRSNDRCQLEPKVQDNLPRAGKAHVDVAIVVNGRTREVVPIHFQITPTEPMASRFAKSNGVMPISNTVPSEEPLPEVTIKQRDLVKLVVFAGPVRIEARGEALQSGRTGEMIRVQNTDSNRVVHGRINEHGWVVVEP